MEAADENDMQSQVRVRTRLVCFVVRVQRKGQYPRFSVFLSSVSREGGCFSRLLSRRGVAASSQDLAQQFVDDELELKPFEKQFLAERKQYHMRNAKIERFRQLNGL